MEYEGELLYDKKYSGKGYDEKGNIIYELINGNGKVIEYWFNGELKFEGEYLNGKRNKGKEYNYKGKLEFEGEFLNNCKWNGKRKEYYGGDELIYEGEYKNGKRNGKGKEYQNGNLIFEGEYSEGQRIQRNDISSSYINF